MDLTANQQAQYNQLVAAGAPASLAMQAAMQVPGSTQTSAPTTPTQTPTATPSAPAATSVSQPSSGSTGSTSADAPSLPGGNLTTGSQGQDVEALQKYLIQQGYLTADQVSGGQGVYGPQTTAAVAKLQKDMGINPTSGSGSYGPQTRAALAQKYNAAFTSLSAKQSPDQSSDANQQIQSAVASQSATSTDPVFGSMASMIGPIFAALTQVMNNINNPVSTYASLQDEYNQVSQQYNLPAMNTQMLNMQNVMNGTENDIRDELSKSGSGGTESQVLAMSAARNKVILKQYNALATNYQAAQTQVDNLMKYASEDQQTNLQKQQITASVSESMASIETQMMGMAQTMQKNTADNLNKIVTNVGYTGLAAQAQGNPQVLGYYEQMLGLAPGSLSDQQGLQQMETYRQKQLALGQQRVTIQMYNAGMGVGGNQTPISIDPTNGNTTTPGGLNIAAGDLTRPSWLPSNVPTYLSGDKMQTAAKQFAFTPDGNNYIAPNIGYYVQNPDGSYYLNSALPQGTAGVKSEQAYQAMASQVLQAQQNPVGGSVLNKGRYSRMANTAIKYYVASPVYQNVANGAVYLTRIAAAKQKPGSISDLDLADSIIKINNGGGQVTEAQLGTYFQGQSYADKFAVIDGKITAKGGVLSPQQRKDLGDLAQETFNEYKTQYDTLYVQAGNNLKGQGIPLNYLSNMPDWTEALMGVKANITTDQ